MSKNLATELTALEKELQALEQTLAIAGPHEQAAIQSKIDRVEARIDALEA